MKKSRRLQCRPLVAALLLLVGLVTALPCTALNANAASSVVITLDPGHGGTEDGTTRYWNGNTVYEKDLNLIIAQYCKEVLESTYQGVTVYLTRTDDSTMSLDDRATYASQVGSDILISIHNNAQGSAQSWTSGAEAIIPNGSYRPELTTEARRVASRILSQLNSDVGVTNQGIIQRTGNNTYPNGTKADYYGLIRCSVLLNLPSTIIEHAFMDNDADFISYLSTDAKLRALGAADAAGIAAAFDLKKFPHSSAENGDTPFTDVYENKWYYDNVTFVYNHGLMGGTSDTLFSPSMVTSRGMIVTILYRLVGSPAVTFQDTFSDVVSGKWYSNAIQWASDNGIVAGFTDGTFRPNDPVTREQLAAFFYRYAQYKGYSTAQTNDLAAFPDSGSVSNYARTSMQWAVGAGLISGSDGLLLPKGSAYRAQSAAILQRFMENCM